MLQSHLINKKRASPNPDFFSIQFFFSAHRLINFSKLTKVLHYNRFSKFIEIEMHGSVDLMISNIKLTLKGWTFSSLECNIFSFELYTCYQRPHCNLHLPWKFGSGSWPKATIFFLITCCSLRCANKKVFIIRKKRKLSPLWSCSRA